MSTGMSASRVDFISIIERLARQEVMSDEVRKDVADIREDIKLGFEKLDSRFATVERRLAATEDAVRSAKLGWRFLVTIGGVVLAVASTAGALLAKWLPLANGLSK